MISRHKILEEIGMGAALAMERPYEVIDIEANIDDLRLDSLGAMGIINHLSVTFGLDTEPVLIPEIARDMNTVQDVVDYVEQHLHSRPAA
jgi:acyl carrier protein